MYNNEANVVVILSKSLGLVLGHSNFLEFTEWIGASSISDLLIEDCILLDPNVVS